MEINYRAETGDDEWTGKVEITTTGQKLVKMGKASEAILWPAPGPKVLIVSPDFSTRAPTLCVRGAGHCQAMD